MIDEAFSSWHPEAFALDGARIVRDLKVRRDHLVDVAGEFFAKVNRNAEVLGSARDDVFELWFEPGGAVRVAIHEKDKHEGDRAPFFDRVYRPDQTAELRLYALAGDDALIVHGQPSMAILIRFVGGEGHDAVSAEPGARSEPLDARAIRFYDSEDGATIDPSIEVRDERSSLARLNEYDQNENHDPDVGAFLPALFVNLMVMFHR